MVWGRGEREKGRGGGTDSYSVGGDCGTSCTSILGF